ncbi:MAG: hypothetical protein ASARMPRED_001752 [Alectoria sarmentosa]|nr:MAG: hypothetical protein ASARMPRED_001752 [Alectoria sarmentosa]
MASQDVYAQAPLVTERREIRILALAPGADDDILRGELIVERSVSESAIILGDSPLHITENLELVLHRIRGPNRPRNLWVDAMCINQNDFEEKNVQVYLMGDIFAKAMRTMVWLGEKSADSDVAMDFVGSLRQWTPVQLDSGSDVDQITLRAITDLMRRKWWTRIWVVQEALKSRSIAVQCGEKQVDLVYFVQLVNGKGFENPLLMEDEPEKPELPAKQSQLDMTRYMSLLTKDRIKKPKPPSAPPFIGILSKWYAYKHQVETGGLSILILMSLTHGFQASVRRDIVFALLGLATPEDRAHIIPDYSGPASDRLVLTRLTMYLLRTSLLPLRFATYCRATDCPSWVPDWMAIDGGLKSLIEKEWPSSKAYLRPNAEHYPQFEPPIENLIRYQEPSALLAYGLIVDQVKIAIRIPHLHDVTSDDFETRAESIKVKIREWKLSMIEDLERYRSNKPKFRITTKRAEKATGNQATSQSQTTKASLITYMHPPTLQL